MMPLRGVKVLEFAGLAPGPFCGKILADFGASVLRIDKVAENHMDVLQRGKASIGLNLKNPAAQAFVKKLVKKCDVLIEPFRPGIMEKLNLGPENLCKENPQLIYARLTGFGQTGRLAPRAGHDLNYVAISGVLSMLGKANENPFPPVNVLADFAGGGVMCAMGICLALLERHHSSLGQVVDAAMVDGCAYISSFLFTSRSLPIWGKDRGKNILDGGAYYYDTYKTKDNKYMTVGALEPQFFETFKSIINLPHLEQFTSDDKQSEQFKNDIKHAFLAKTQNEWSKLFEDTDSCVYPVVEWEHVISHDHNHERNTFEKINNEIWPNPAPRLNRTPGKLSALKNITDRKAAAVDFIMDLGINKTEVEELENQKILLLPAPKANL